MDRLAALIPDSRRLVMHPPEGAYTPHTHGAQWLFHLMNRQPEQFRKQLAEYATRRAGQHRKAAKGSAAEESHHEGAALAWLHIGTPAGLIDALCEHYTAFAETEAEVAHTKCPAAETARSQPLSLVDSWLRQACGSGALRAPASAARAFVRWHNSGYADKPSACCAAVVQSGLLLIPRVPLATRTLKDLVGIACGDVARAEGNPIAAIEALAAVPRQDAVAAARAMLQDHADIREKTDKPWRRQLNAAADAPAADGTMPAQRFGADARLFCTGTPLCSLARSVLVASQLPGQPTELFVCIVDSEQMRNAYSTDQALYVFPAADATAEEMAALCASVSASAAASWEVASSPAHRWRLALAYIRIRDGTPGGGPSLDYLLLGDGDDVPLWRARTIESLAQLLGCADHERAVGVFLKAQTLGGEIRVTDALRSSEGQRRKKTKPPRRGSVADYNIAMTVMKPASAGDAQCCAAAVDSLLRSAQLRYDDDFQRCAALLEALAMHLEIRCRADAVPAGGYCAREPFQGM